MIATKKAIELAKRFGYGNVTIKNVHHIGRLGAYTSLAARNNMIGFACANYANKFSMRVTPFGGREGRIATNPFSFACPTNKEYPFLVDMATSTVAEGKVRVARNRNENIPYNWIINKYGNVSNNPNDLYNGGALLPLGGLELGYKGFALGLIVEILAGLLSRNKTMQRNIEQSGEGVFIFVIDIERYLPLKEFKEEIENLFIHIKDTPTMDGFEKIMIPGEIEYHKKEKNLKEGIVLEDKTWNEIVCLAENLGMDIDKIR